MARVSHKIQFQSRLTLPEGIRRYVLSGGAPVKDAVVVIEGNRIKAVGMRGSVAIPTQAKVESHAYADLDLYHAQELETLTPEVVRQGDAGTEIEVTGAKFSPQSVIRFDTTDLPTKFSSESELTATLKGSLLKSPGTYAVTVTNPGPSGGVSKALYLIINFRK